MLGDGNIIAWDLNWALTWLCKSTYCNDIQDSWMVAAPPPSLVHHTAGAGFGGYQGLARSMPDTLPLLDRMWDYVLRTVGGGWPDVPHRLRQDCLATGH